MFVFRVARREKEFKLMLFEIVAGKSLKDKMKRIIIK